MEGLSVASLSHSSRNRLSHRLVGAILLFVSLCLGSLCESVF